MLRRVVAGPHPESSERWLVHRPDTGDLFELTPDTWKIASAFEGPATSGDAARNLRARPEDIEKAVKLLCELDLLMPASGTNRPAPLLASPEPSQWRRGPVPEQFELVVHPAARFTCVGCGTCCERSYVIALDQGKAAALRAGATRLGLADPVVLLPSEPNQPWMLALGNERACPFLNDRRGCNLHDDPAQPDACRVFPMVFAAHESRVFASVSHRCGCGALGRGEPLIDQLSDLKMRLRASPFVSRLPEETRLDRTRVLPTSRLARVWEAVLEQDDGAWGYICNLVAALEAVPAGGFAEPVRALAARWAKDPSSSDDRELRYVLRSRRHPDADQVRKDLRRTGLEDPAADVGEEVARLVRDYLAGFRPFQHATLAEGLFALGLAVASILDGDPDHPEARTRIMIWEDALPSATLRRLVGRTGPSAEVTGDLRRVADHLHAWAAGASS